MKYNLSCHQHQAIAKDGPCNCDKRYAHQRRQFRLHAKAAGNRDKEALVARRAFLDRRAAK